jgi:CubicO group peptidase (beta-lactamase class C family)
MARRQVREHGGRGGPRLTIGHVAPTLRPGAPEDAAMDSARIERIRALAQSWIDDGTHTALVLLAARRGVVVLDEAYGLLAPDASPLPLDAIFPFQSATKPITGALMLCLVEDGLVGLNRPLQGTCPSSWVLARKP